MGLSVGSASWPAPTPAPGPPFCLPISPSQGFVFFSPLFPVCDKQDSCQPSRALSPCPRLAVYTIPLRGLEGVPGLPGAPQDEAGLTRKFETSHVGRPALVPILLGSSISETPGNRGHL